jgi:dTDP-glucose pyrophosphorylase
LRRRPSSEITDVNNRYIDWGDLQYEMLDGWWTDAGTIPSLFRASRLVAGAAEPSGEGPGVERGIERASSAASSRGSGGADEP